MVSRLDGETMPTGNLVGRLVGDLFSPVHETKLRIKETWERTHCNRVESRLKRLLSMAERLTAMLPGQQGL